MDISSQINIGKTLPLNDEGLGLSSFTQLNKSEQSKVQKQFNQQFNQVASKSSDEIEDSGIKSEVSQQKEVIQQNYNNLQKIDDLKVTQYLDTELPDDMIEELLENNSGLKKLEKQKKETTELLEKKLIGEKTSTGFRSLLSGATISIFSKWLKKLSKKKNEIEDTEELSTEEISDTHKTESSSPTQQKTSSANITKQQKLFTLNLRSSIRFLKNMNSLSKRFYPELLIYEEETGYVDAEKTLECLGWQNVSAYQQTLFNQLTNESLNNINNVKKILSLAIENGLEIYRGQHPIFSKEENILAVEILTGELTILNNLIELQKLQLDDNVLQTQQVSDR